MFLPSPEPPKPGDPPPPPPDVAQNDLMMRLGLLLGDRMSPRQPSPSMQQTGNQTEETSITSTSSLTSNEEKPEKTMSDTSPVSTLTGEYHFLRKTCFTTVPFEMT